MLASLKSEFRKLLTVRSTYLLFTAAFLLAVGLIGFWIYGYKDVSHASQSHEALQSAINSAVTFVGIFFSFVTVLLVGHEYRYNTIMYSLTSASGRGKVFFSKFLAAAVIALLATVVIVACTVGSFHIGQNVHHVNTISQSIDWWPATWRAVVSLVGSVAYAFIIAILIRSLIGAVAVVLLLPSTIEGLLMLLLKDNVKYLPYTSLGNLTSDTPAHGASYLFSLAVIGAYAFGGGLIAYILFLKRDAN